MRNQRSFSLEFKRQVVEELMSGESGPAQLCRRHNITLSLLYHWKKQYSRGKFNNEPTEEGALRNRVEKLDVCIFKGGGFFTFVQHAMKILSHRYLNDPQVEYYQCREIVVESAHSLPVHVDGEPFTRTPVAIHTVPSSLKVIVPKIMPANLFSSLT
jgi:hypothetical protein